MHRITHIARRRIASPVDMAIVCATQLKVAVLHELQYRAHLVLQIAYTAVSVATALIGLRVVFSHAPTLDGWTQPELLVVVGMHLVVGGFVGAIVQPGLKLMMEQVRLGTLDFTLLKPQDPQLLSSTQRIEPFKLVDVVAGVGVAAYGLVHVSGSASPQQVATFAVVAIAGAACCYHAWVLLSTASFWFVRTGELLDIARASFEAGRWPVSLYPGWLKHALTFVVPVGIAVTAPADALVHGLAPVDVAVIVGFSIVLGVVTRVVWRTALRSYSGASA